MYEHNNKIKYGTFKNERGSSTATRLLQDEGAVEKKQKKAYSTINSYSMKQKMLDKSKVRLR